MPATDSWAQVVLVVDDDEDIRELYAEALELNGYDVLQARDGEAAVEIARVAPVTAVVMDLDMPIMDGFAATQALKQDPRTAHTPVVVVTGSTQGEKLTRARIVGCDALLSKPCPPDVVILAIQHVLTGQPIPPPYSVFDDG